MSDNEKITKAVIAHVRHTETPYDSLLQQAREYGPSENRREDARARVRAQVNDVLRAWRPETTHTLEAPKAVNPNPYRPPNTCLAEASINLVPDNVNQMKNISKKQKKCVAKSGHKSLMASAHAPNNVTTLHLSTDKSQAKIEVIQKTSGPQTLDTSIHAHKSKELHDAVVDTSPYLTRAVARSKRQAAVAAERHIRPGKHNRKAKKKEARRKRRELAEQHDQPNEEERQLEAMMELARLNSKKMWDDPTFGDTLSANNSWAVSQFRNTRSAKNLKKVLRRFLRTQMSGSTSSNPDAISELPAIDQIGSVSKEVHPVNALPAIDQISSSSKEVHPVNAIQELSKKDDSDDDCVMLFECPVLKPAKPMAGMKFITDLHLSRHAPVISYPRLSGSSQVPPRASLDLEQRKQTSGPAADKQTPSPNHAIRDSFMMMDINDGDHEPLGARDPGKRSAASGLKKNHSVNRTLAVSCSRDENAREPEIWMEID